jgi:hypothetical protein
MMRKKIILFYQVVKSKVCKEACIRNTKEKKNFLKGQIENIYTAEVLRVKAPHFYVGENNIPDNKNQTGN